MELLLGEVEVWSRQTRVTAQKDSNFLSYRWIMLIFL
jgi:hypothetical protein